MVYQKKKIKKKDSHTKNQLEAIVDYIAEYCEEKGIRRLSNICMPPLPELLTYENGERLDSEEIYAYIGLLDDPDRQSQEKLKINITAQNYILIGSAQCGKTNVLQTIIRSMPAWIVTKHGKPLLPIWKQKGHWLKSKIITTMSALAIAAEQP